MKANKNQSPSPAKMIIGLVGTFAAGKDVAASYLAEKGFNHISTGDTLRSIIQTENLGGGSLDRDNLRVQSNKLRKERGGDFLIKFALEQGGNKLAISGIRAVSEAQAVIDRGGVIIAVDAPVTLRFKRLRDRGRLDDDITEEKFVEQEKAEIGNDDPDAINLTAVIAMANYDIANDSTLEVFHQRLDEVLKRLKKSNGQKS